jgi:hypothetical protein
MKNFLFFVADAAGSSACSMQQSTEGMGIFVVLGMLPLVKDSMTVELWTNAAPLCTLSHQNEMQMQLPKSLLKYLRHFNDGKNSDAHQCLERVHDDHQWCILMIVWWFRNHINHVMLIRVQMRTVMMRAP